jgi:tRNA C32,U32 (ribose-2'-O)-methylase TrmJ
LQGQGLSEKQIQLCDGFVYISQYGEGTASLNVAVAASIVLHNFAVWAQYPERERQGAKFEVAPRPQRTRQRGVVPLTPEEQKDLQLQRRGHEDAAEQAAEWLSTVMQQHGGLDGLLGAVGTDDCTKLT